jgi:hypothetical protein
MSSDIQPRIPTFPEQSECNKHMNPGLGAGDIPWLGEVTLCCLPDQQQDSCMSSACTAPDPGQDGGG